jgi:type I restriction enzyme R subunit
MPLPYAGKKGELNFEADLIEELKKVGWEKDILKNKTEKDLIDNWREIINVNNRVKLNNIDLSDNEMMQIMDYVHLNCNTPVKANIFINGKNICITRDGDSKDTEHAGKEVYLDIFDPVEIAGGKSRYQIAEQIIFDTSAQYNDRRGDVMLLINGIPVIHIELKASGVPVSEATNQIQKYAKEGIFAGVFSLIQVFFAMNPEEAVYFANPGEWTNYNDAFYFHWGDKLNEPINDWKVLCKGENSILSIPEAHQLIGYYTVADKSKEILKVSRSYQYHAIKAIIKRVHDQKWGNHTPLGGYVWCTTGGGKTMTSFKAGQLIIDKGFADKIIFVVDRVELNTQSLEEYNSFSRDGEEVQETKNTQDLFNKLKSNDSKNSMMVTSIQKLERINDEDYKTKITDLNIIKDKRIIFIIDEAHRSQFGEMHEKVKNTFLNALFIGFTGTPIFSENDKDGCTTETVFGKCLSVYSIACGIRDGNVLGFDPKAIKTYEDKDLKKAVALEQSKSKDEKEAQKDLKKYKIYKYYMKLDMVTTKDKKGNNVKGIEDLLPAKQYDNDKHRNSVVDDILDNWGILSLGERGTRFHAILSTSSIPEAYAYYKILKSRGTGLNITSLFDPNIDNSGTSALDKEDALIEIVDDYNRQYGTTYNRDTDPNYKSFKKDIIKRLSHKKEYKHISKDSSQCIDILIVVDQMLTGFDSQYVNTLYLDRVLETDRLIQAISRTNRVYDKEEKPFGIFRFYRKPYTMQKNLEDALRLYCEGDTSGAVAATIDENIDLMNLTYATIDKIFKNDGIVDFMCLPKSDAACQKFKKEFAQLKVCMNSVRLQGFKWTNKYGAMLVFDEKTYKILEMRYKDLTHRGSSGPGVPGSGYNLNTIISEMAMEKIDADYLESHFKQVVPIILGGSPEDEKENAINEFLKELATLPGVHQIYAHKIIEDIKSGELVIDNDKTLNEYIQEYMSKDANDKIKMEADLFGLDVKLFEEIVKTTQSERDLNEHNRFNELLKTADKDKVSKYFLDKEGVEVKGLQLNAKLNKELKEFILGKQED